MTGMLGRTQSNLSENLRPHLNEQNWMLLEVLRPPMTRAPSGILASWDESSHQIGFFASSSYYGLFIHVVLQPDISAPSSFHSKLDAF